MSSVPLGGGHLETEARQQRIGSTPRNVATARGGRYGCTASMRRDGVAAVFQEGSGSHVSTARASFANPPTASSRGRFGASKPQDSVSACLGHGVAAQQVTTSSSLAQTPAPTGTRRGNTRFSARGVSGAAVDHVAREQFASPSDAQGRTQTSTSLARTPAPAGTRRGSGRFTAAREQQRATRGGDRSGAGLPQYGSPNLARAGQLRDGMFVAAAPPQQQQQQHEQQQHEQPAAAASQPAVPIMGGGQLLEKRRVQHYVPATENFNPGRHDARRTCGAAVDHVAAGIMSSPAAPPRAPGAVAQRGAVPHYCGGTTRYAARDAGRCAIDHLGPSVVAPPPFKPSEDIASVLFGGYE